MSVTIATRTSIRTQPALADPADRARAWLGRLFAGDFAFPTIPVVALPAADRHPAEHDALSRALGCRDLFVVHADPAAGERIIADLVRHAPDRVLILTPAPAAADHLTERLLKCGAAVVRALADDENPTRPSPAVSKVTSVGLGVVQADHDRRAALAAVAAAEGRIGAFAVVSKAVARLNEVNDLLAKFDTEVTDLAAARDGVEGNLAAEAKGATPTAFTDALEKVQLAFTVEFNDLCARKGAADEAVRAKEAEALALRSQHAAAGKNGFFTRLFSKPKAGTDPDDLKRHLDTVEAELVALKAVAATADATATARRVAYEADHAKVAADELAARRAAAEAALAAAEAERDRARAEAAALNKAISVAVPHDDYTTAARELAAARERAAEAARTGPEALARVTAGLRAVVGTPGSLTDPIFTAFPDEPPFGLLILDRAEELPEAEFPRLARLAERWVLVGDTAPRDERPLNGRPRPGRPAEVPFVCRVAKLLDRETWAPEGDRLVCRLQHLSPEQRRHVAREPLADRPEIELRFVDAGGEPLLAEIVFPGATAIPDAKSFLFHTLNEVLLRPCGEAVWSHAPGAITATFPLSDGPHAVWIDLEPGVREKVSGAGLFAYTAAVAFDPAAGWDADRAAEWLAARLPPPPIGRFAPVPRTR